MKFPVFVAAAALLIGASASGFGYGNSSGYGGNYPGYGGNYHPGGYPGNTTGPSGYGPYYHPMQPGCPYGGMGPGMGRGMGRGMGYGMGMGMNPAMYMPFPMMPFPPHEEHDCDCFPQNLFHDGEHMHIHTYTTLPRHRDFCSYLNLPRVGDDVLDVVDVIEAVQDLIEEIDDLSD
jgi:hypothetical protein